MSARFFSWALAAVVATCVGVALVWALVVPAFQEPDELAHVDYAFALYDAGRPFVVHDAFRGSVVTPEANYLARIAHFREMRYNPFAREPPAAMPFRFALHADPAAPRASHRVPSDGSRMPYVMFWYPLPYYVALAVAMRIADAFTRGSVADAFLTARLLNVALLIPTLLLVSRILRHAGLDRTTTLYATFAIGAFPLTSWVAGYVQPDNLSLLLMTATLFTAMRWRERPLSTARALALATVIAGLFLTKYQYAFAAWLTALLVTSSHVNVRELRSGARAIAIVATLPIAAFGVALAWTPVSRNTSMASLAQSATVHVGEGMPHLVLGAVASTLFDALDAYFGGGVFNGFWFDFGFRSGSVVTGILHRVLAYVLIGLTLAFFVTFGSLTRQRWIRIARIARVRSVRSAIRCLGSGIAAYLYFGTTAVLFVARAVTDERLQLLGRYWLPVIVPGMVLVLADLPRLIPSLARRRAAARGAATAMALACGCASIAAVHAMYENFYVPTSLVPTFASVARIENVTNGTDVRDLTATVSLRDDHPTHVRGFAIDGHTGLPAQRVVLVVDGNRRYAAATGLASPGLAEGFHDDAVAKSGFAITLPSYELTPGVHHLRVQIEDGSKVPVVRVGGDIDVLVGTRARRGSA